MKRSGSLILTAAFLLFGAGTAWSQTQSLSGSAHDFSGQAWNTTGEVCVVCHAPHANQNAVGELLWNRSPSVASYDMYSNASGTFQGSGTIATSPNPESKVCLSCHDGTVALNSFGGNGTVTDAFVTGDFLIDTDLSDDHPISFEYTNALATSDGALAAPGDDGTGPTDVMPLFGTTFTLECATCHDVHNNVNTGNTKLLYIENTASALCTTCHTK